MIIAAVHVHCGDCFYLLNRTTELLYILFFYDEQSIAGMQMSGTVRYNVFAAAAYHHHQRSGRQIHVSQSIAGLKMTLGQRYGMERSG